MKSPLLRGSLLVFLAAGIPFTSTPGKAEKHCPAEASTLHPRLLADALLVIPVKINQSGPYEFLVDTGSQPNIIDPSLASSLNLKLKGPVGLITASTLLHGSVATVNSLEAGGYTLKSPAVVVEDLGPIQAADPNVRGVLGENFLAHFNLLIDYSHLLLCLDLSNRMQDKVRGERIPLVPPRDPEDELPFLDRLIISVNLSASGKQDILLQVDSGSTGPVLYGGNKKLERLLKRAKVPSSTVDKSRRSFGLLPLQDVRLGSHVVPKVPFVTPIRAELMVSDRDEDGILATVMFRRVYISHSDRFIIFDPN